MKKLSSQVGINIHARYVGSIYPKEETPCILHASVTNIYLAGCNRYSYRVENVSIKLEHSLLQFTTLFFIRSGRLWILLAYPQF